MSPDRARTDLDRAAAASRRTRSYARSGRVYSFVNAAGWAASLLFLGLVDPLGWRIALWLAALVLPLVGVVWWYRRRTATASFPPPRGGPYIYGLGMAFLAGVTAVVGTAAGLHGVLWFWLPAALVSVAPMIVLALTQPRP